MQIKKRLTPIVGVIIILSLGLLYYLRPIWWESYHYENDQVRIRISGANDGSHGTFPAGTLVVRITGTGMENCGWGYSAGKNSSGSASGALLSIDSVRTEFTDSEGYANVLPDEGFATGERIIMGGCQHNRGFLLLIVRPGYVTKAEMPRFDQVNASFHVISTPDPRRETMPVIDYARNRLWNELRLLYPTRINSLATRPEEAIEREALMEMVEYWQHRLPDGQTIRSYAIKHVLQVNAKLACPRIQAEIRRIMSDPQLIPATEEEVLAEHRALLRVNSTYVKNHIDTCEPNPE